MARQSKTIDTPPEISGSKSARALSHLDRMAGFAEESSRIARATAGVATAAGDPWQLTAHAAKLLRTFAAGASSLNATARVTDAIRGNEATPSRTRLNDSDGAIDRESRSTLGGHANAWHRTIVSSDAGGRTSREIRELSLATDALSRLERSIELGSAGWANSTAGRRLTQSGLHSSNEFAGQAHRAIEIAQAMVATNMESPPRSGAGRFSSRSQESLEAGRKAFAGTGLLANARMASSIRAVMPPANLSQREFTEPSVNARGANNSGARTGITVNSSPTVVINSPAAGGNIARDAIGALREHREELFNQLKRESARRERAQF